MSTTVTYKGSTLTTAENQTRTLKTSGKYLEDDITIVDVTSGSVIGGITQDANGYLVIDPNGSGVPITVESLSVTNNGIYTAPTGKAYSPVSVSVSGQVPVLQAKSKTYTPTESQQTETITADTGYDGLSQVDVTVNAISSSYVGSAIDRRDSTNLSANGATVTAPAGYYASSASKSVASGSVTAPATISGTSATVSTGTNTLTLSKTVSVTPSVTTAGYVSSGTAGNSSVSLTASVNTRGSSDLSVSGDTVTAPSGYYSSSASTSVASGTAGTPTATKGTVSNHSISVTPSVTNTTGYITGSTKTGTAVTVSASELVSGSETKTANGTYDVTNLAELVVNVSGGGGGGVKKKQINFIDYDGTIVYSYTKAEWQNVTALPSGPTHTGLISRGWNWSKTNIDTQLLNVPDGDVWVGQSYSTSNSKTQIDVSFPNPTRLSPELCLAVNGTVTIDWGDNSTPDTVTGTSTSTVIATSHTYPSVGDYTIQISRTSGTYTIYGNTTYGFFRKNSAASVDQNRVYSSCVKAVRLGLYTAIGSYAFYYCSSLETITCTSASYPGTHAFYMCSSLKSMTIPYGTILYTNVFRSCSALKTVSLPDTCTSIGTYAFYGCSALESVTIQSNTTQIGEYAFYNCRAMPSIHLPNIALATIAQYAFYNMAVLASMTIPSSVTTIGNYVFANCYGMTDYHIKPTTPPTLGSSVFSGIPSECVIYVPTESLETYQTTSGWSSYASRMVGE